MDQPSTTTAIDDSTKYLSSSSLQTPAIANSNTISSSISSTDDKDDDHGIQLSNSIMKKDSNGTITSSSNDEIDTSASPAQRSLTALEQQQLDLVNKVTLEHLPQTSALTIDKNKLSISTISSPPVINMDDEEDEEEDEDEDEVLHIRLVKRQSEGTSAMGSNTSSKMVISSSGTLPEHAIQSTNSSTSSNAAVATTITTGTATTITQGSIESSNSSGIKQEESNHIAVDIPLENANVVKELNESINSAKSIDQDVPSQEKKYAANEFNGNKGLATIPEVSSSALSSTNSLHDEIPKLIIVNNEKELDMIKKEEKKMDLSLERTAESTVIDKRELEQMGLAPLEEAVEQQQIQQKMAQQNSTKEIGNSIDKKASPTMNGEVMKQNERKEESANKQEIKLDTNPAEGAGSLPQNPTSIKTPTATTATTKIQYDISQFQQPVYGNDDMKVVLEEALNADDSESDDSEDDVFRIVFCCRCCGKAERRFFTINGSRSTCGRLLKWFSKYYFEVLRLFAFVLFTVLTAYYVVNCNYIAPECAGGQVFLWKWFLTAALWCIAWPLSRLIFSTIIVVASRSASQEARRSEQTKKELLSITVLYYLPPMKWHVSMLFTLVIATISFYADLAPQTYLLFPSTSPTTFSPTISGVSATTSPTVTESPTPMPTTAQPTSRSAASWAAWYTQLLNILTLLCVYFIGKCLAIYFTSAISREFNTRTYGEKIEALIKQELVLFKLLGGIPFSVDNFVYGMIDNPIILKNDPRIYTAMSRHVRKHPFRLMLSRGDDNDDSIVAIPAKDIKYDVDVVLASPRIAELVGRICFRCIWGHAEAHRKAEAAATAESLLKIEKVESSRTITSEDDVGEDGQVHHQNSIRGTDSHSQVSENVSNSENPKTSFFLHATKQSGSLHSPESGMGSSLFKAQSSLAMIKLSKKARHGMLSGSRRKQQIKKEDLHHVLAAPDPPIFPKLPEGTARLHEIVKRQEKLLKFNVDDVWTFLDVEKLGYCEKKHVGAAFVKFYEDRKNLASTLTDARDVVRTLESVISTAMNFLVFLCGLAIWGLDVVELWVGISSILLAFTFVFSGTASNAFSAIVFVFGTHPYDVGDLVRVGSDWYRVMKIQILNTIMQRWDGSLVTYNNTELSKTPIYNLRTSGPYSKDFHVWLDMDVVTQELIDYLRAEMRKYVDSDKENYSGNVSVNAREFGEPLKVRITIWVEYTFTEAVRSKVNPYNSLTVLQICGLLTKLGIRFTGVELGRMDLGGPELPPPSSQPSQPAQPTVNAFSEAADSKIATVPTESKKNV